MPTIQDPWLVAVELSPAGDVCPLPTTLLNTQECRRAERFVRPGDRHSFVAAHVLKRLALSAATGMDARDMEFFADQFGKPHLIGCGAVHFNLSHTSSMVVLAWSRSGPVGVDVECLDRVVFDHAVAKLALTDDELEVLEHATDWQRTFLLFWTAKEAVMKAEGKGMSMPMTEIKVIGRLAATPSSCWQLRQYLPSNRHILALACESAAADNLVPCQMVQERDLWHWARSSCPPASVDVLPSGLLFALSKDATLR